MSTVAVIAIVVGALILLAILVVMSRRRAQRHELGRVQNEAQHEDVRHHRDRADQRRQEAEMAEERAKRARAEAELNEERAESRERELDGDPGRNGDAGEVERDRSTERR